MIIKKILINLNTIFIALHLDFLYTHCRYGEVDMLLE